MIKRGNASKRAKAELFSNETETIELQKTDNTEVLRRNKLKSEMFGDHVEASPVSDAAVSEQVSLPDKKTDDVYPSDAEITSVKTEVRKAETSARGRAGIAYRKSPPLRTIPTGVFPKVKINDNSNSVPGTKIRNSFATGRLSCEAEGKFLYGSKSEQMG